MVGGHLVEKRFFAVEHTDAGGAVDLVAAEDEKVAVERLHVDGEVGHALGAVHQKVGAGIVGDARHFGHGVDGAEDVAHVAAAHQSGAVGEEGVVGVEVKHAAVVHGDDLEDDALPLAQQLPRHDVGVVLHRGEDDLIARFQKAFTEGGGHEVEAFGRPPGEDDFGRGTGVDEAPHRLACPFVQVGGALGEEVHTAVHVGVGLVVLRRHGFHHATRLLGGGGVVEVDERTVVDFASKDGEVVTIMLHDGGMWRESFLPF